MASLLLCEHTMSWFLFSWMQTWTPALLSTGKTKKQISRAGMGARGTALLPAPVLLARYRRCGRLTPHTYGTQTGQRKHISKISWQYHTLHLYSKTPCDSSGSGSCPSEYRIQESVFGNRGGVRWRWGKSSRRTCVTSVSPEQQSHMPIETSHERYDEDVCFTRLVYHICITLSTS